MRLKDERFRVPLFFPKKPTTGDAFQFSVQRLNGLQNPSFSLFSVEIESYRVIGRRRRLCAAGKEKKDRRRRDLHQQKVVRFSEICGLFSRANRRRRLEKSYLPLRLEANDASSKTFPALRPFHILMKMMLQSVSHSFASLRLNSGFLPQILFIFDRRNSSKFYVVQSCFLRSGYQSTMRIASTLRKRKDFPDHVSSHLSKKSPIFIRRKDVVVVPFLRANSNFIIVIAATFPP